MSEYFSDGFFGASPDSGPDNWSEKDWLDYINTADTEIEKIAKVYYFRRKNDDDFIEIMKDLGIADILSINIETLHESAPLSEFSDTPLTLINHPIFIITNAVLKALNYALKNLCAAYEFKSLKIWELAELYNKISKSIFIAVNSTDLGEENLFRFYYKSAAQELNLFLRLIENLNSEEENLSEHLDFIQTIVLDLRQLCLNLS